MSEHGRFIAAFNVLLALVADGAANGDYSTAALYSGAAVAGSLLAIAAQKLLEKLGPITRGR